MGFISSSVKYLVPMCNIDRLQYHTPYCIRVDYLYTA